IYCIFIFFFFFFQAEDGIRDRNVTGVQTCALPISFYRDFLGLKITKQNWRAGVVFLSADAKAADHEIALVRGRPAGEEPRLIQRSEERRVGKECRSRWWECQ